MTEPQEKLDSETADATDISKPWDKDNKPGGIGMSVLQRTMLKKIH